MNIYFMDKEHNGVPTPEVDWRGETRYKYIPNFDLMLTRASCEEEAEAIKETRRYLEEGIFDGFNFEIVYMDYCMGYNYEENKWEMKWQMLQHPWYNNLTKEGMVKEIEACAERYRKEHEGWQ